MQKGKLKQLFYSSLTIFFGLALAYLFVRIMDMYVFNGFIGGILNLSNIARILRPIIIGGVLAYIMKSTCNFFDRIYVRALTKSGRRDKASASKTANALSLITTYVIWLAAIAGLIFLTIEPLFTSIKSLAESLYNNIPMWTDKALNFAREKLGDNPDMLKTFEQAVENLELTVTGWLSNDLPNMITQATDLIVSGIISIAGIVMDVLIGIVVSFMLLAGRKTLATKSKMFVECIFKKDTSKLIIDECKYADKMFSGFLEGKIIDSAIVGVLYYIALLIMDVQYAPLIAVIGGITNIIPFFGPFIGAVPSSLIILGSDGAFEMLVFIIFVCVMQFLDGYIIEPHIVSGSIKLSVFSTLFAVIFFGGLWGFWGLLVGTPVFAVLYDIGKKIAYAILRKRGKEHIIEEYEKKHKEPVKKKRRFSFRRFFRKLLNIQGHPDDTEYHEEQSDRSDDPDGDTPTKTVEDIDAPNCESVDNSDQKSDKDPVGDTVETDENKECETQL